MLRDDKNAMQTGKEQKNGAPVDSQRLGWRCIAGILAASRVIFGSEASLALSNRRTSILRFRLCGSRQSPRIMVPL